MASVKQYSINSNLSHIQFADLQYREMLTDYSDCKGSKQLTSKNTKHFYVLNEKNEH